MFWVLYEGVPVNGTMVKRLREKDNNATGPERE